MLLYRNAAVRWDPKSFLLFNSQLELQGIFVHEVKKPLKQIKKVVNKFRAAVISSKFVSLSCHYSLSVCLLSVEFFSILENAAINYSTVSSKVHTAQA